MKGHAKPNSTFLADFYGDAYDPTAAQLLSTGVFVLIDSVNDFLQLRGPAVMILAGREDGLVGTQGMTAVRGTLLIIGYCLGLGLPFLLVALGSARAMRTISWMR